MRRGPAALLLLALLLAALNAAVEFLLGYLPVSPYAHLLTLGQQQFLGLAQVGAVLLALGLGAVAPLGWAAKPLRGYATALLVALVAAVPLWFVAGAQAARLRQSAFGAFLERSVAVTAAIERFAALQGRPPADLTELVPEFLPAVPTTGMPGYAAYEFVSGAESRVQVRQPLGSPCSGSPGRDELGLLRLLPAPELHNAR
jgi:hypothetical protein